MILLATLALAMTLFGGVFLLVLLIFRMTLEILQESRWQPGAARRR